MEPIIFDRSDGQDLRINMISPWLKRHYAELGLDSPAKIVKLSLDGGFTCPNRDGSKGTGGCLFCSESGSGDMASSLTPPLSSRTDAAAAAADVAGAADTVDTTDAAVDSADAAVDSADAAVDAGKADGRSSMPGACLAAGGIRDALSRQIRLLSDKWPADKYNLKYIAYFQSHTNTYAPVDELRVKFESALCVPDVVGLAIATRPDCISEDALDLLGELNKKTFLWVELGLQTIHNPTARAMNLCHDLADYDDAVCRLTSRGIRVVTHLILGLPGETPEMMLDSVRHVCRPVSSSCAENRAAGSDRHNCQSAGTPVCAEGRAAGSRSCRIFGLKLHMLNVVRGSGMAAAMPDYVPFDSMDEYIDLLIAALEIVPPEITLHRISGDAPRASLIAPEWSYRKRTILNNIHKEMRRRNTWQGRLCE